MRARVPFLLAILVYLLVVAGYGVWSYHQDRDVLLEEVDRRLLIGAQTIPHLLPEDYHDRATGPEAISPEEYRKVLEDLSHFTWDTGYLFAYTAVLDDGRVYLTSSNASAREWLDEDFVEYYEHYDDVAPEMLAAFEGNEPQSFWFHDEWGSGRSVVVPLESPEGRRYLAGVDYRMEDMHGLMLRTLAWAVTGALVVFLATVPILLAYGHQTQVHLKDLKQGNERLRSELERRTEAERALRERSEQLRLALYGADLGTWDYNMATDTTTVNERYASMLGLSVEEVPSSYEEWLALIHPDDREKVTHLAQAHLRGETDIYEVETRMHHKDGSFVWVLSHGRMIERDSEDKPVRMCGTHLDVTARHKAAEEAHRLEAQMQHTQKLESLGVLAGGIAHDFNNLLLAIMGHADLALDTLPGDSPARQDLEEIETACRRAADLCGQMLAYSGRGTLVIQEVVLDALIKEMASLLRTSISKKARLELRVDAPVSPIQGDPTQLRQVVMNLIVNASEALGDRQGTITVALSEGEFSEDDLRNPYATHTCPTGRYVCLSVEDDGCGMGPQTLERLFEPFFTTKFTGRGLGMSAVLGIVHGHGGCVLVDSTPGQGSCFQVFLPVGDGSGQIPAPAVVRGDDSGSEWRGQGVVLLVDDEKHIRNLGHRMLERLGFEVLTAEDGIDALRVYEANAGRVDLVILDLMMPNMDGEETLGELRKRYPLVRVVLSSGYGEKEVLERFAGRGVLGVIPKPYTLQALQECLGPLLGRPE